MAQKKRNANKKIAFSKMVFGMFLQLKILYQKMAFWDIFVVKNGGKKRMTSSDKFYCCLNTFVNAQYKSLMGKIYQMR